MGSEGVVDDFEVKRANVRHHDVEAGFFERVHPEGCSVYERANVSRSIAFIVENSKCRGLCVDVGCGTGFVTGFELPFYGVVVAADISRGMLKVAKARLKNAGSVNFVLCDAEFLPFRSGVADLVSVSSVLHHLPKPFRAVDEVSRILRKGGFVFITREPSFQRFRRFFDFLDYFVVGRFLKFARFLGFGADGGDLSTRVEGLDYGRVDVHYPVGFHAAQLSEAFLSRGFMVFYAYSYHWIYPDSNRGWLQNLLTRSNFLFERLPFADRFGRYVTVIARKTV